MRTSTESGGSARIINLEHGEATFEVLHDTSRPFEVHAGNVIARALGTEFDVQSSSGAVTVSVLSGTVQVIRASGEEIGSAALHADVVRGGEAVSYRSHEPSAIRPADVGRIKAWRTRRVQFDNVTLEKALDEYNRHLRTPIEIGDPGIADLHISGVFRVDDPEGLLRMLQEAGVAEAIIWPAGLPGLCKLFSVSRTLPAAVAARHDRQVVDRMLEMHSQSPIEAERQLLAIEQIKRLQAAYFRTLDGKLWEELAQLFTPDCEFITFRDPDNVDPKRRCGRDAIVASIRRTVGDALTLHQGQLLEIDIGARDSATAVWEMQDYAEIPQGASVRILRGAGRYYEHYRLLGDQWMIARLELKRTSLLIE